MTRRIQFGVFFQGVNFGTIWSHDESGSQYDFESFRRIAQTAERGLFSAFFLGEGLRLREHFGRVHELDIAGRPDAQTQLAALAAVTERIGLVATQNTTYNDPYDLARRLSSLDLLSEGRAGWNVVTTDNAWTGENFRRGGYLDHADRYRRAAQVVAAAQRLWDADAGTPVTVDGDLVSLSGPAPLPASPQGRPVLFQAGDSDEGREFAASTADVIFSAHPGLDDAASFAADVRGRLARHGRRRDALKFFPGQQFILAPTDAEAEEKAEWVTHAQVSPQTALRYLEPIWGRDLSDHDPDGPLPRFDPTVAEVDGRRGSAFQGRRAKETADEWRGLADAEGLSIREFVIRHSGRRTIVGGFGTVADLLVRYVDAGAVDGFNVSPYLVPSGLDDIVDGLVPELQERGVYPDAYPGTTLRENLGLPTLSSAASAASAA
ncbi:NtaA/DmoA family FMN-dependent monooxygenase [Microbacterium sp. No. 7]|uniref:NtaA/DmoA family FMN-dependent monooxygenase n=1 Tax=Microbacterium sp. No. 7 TaxID=1714373 RepID=UPI0006D25421|nr:NtaA/DmoA family FMN-dependent monooxygenase [Microbacterium sp. No. 7]ALJ19150.1 F420-dependent methylene-tetrahydromethanopterin reductase [Microbacterium sp. No. 7]